MWLLAVSYVREGWFICKGGMIYLQQQGTGFYESGDSAQIFIPSSYFARCCPCTGAFMNLILGMCVFSALAALYQPHTILPSGCTFFLGCCSGQMFSITLADEVIPSWLCTSEINHRPSPQCPFSIKRYTYKMLSLLLEKGKWIPGHLGILLFKCRLQLFPRPFGSVNPFRSFLFPGWKEMDRTAFQHTVLCSVHTFGF